MNQISNYCTCPVPHPNCFSGVCERCHKPQKPLENNEFYEIYEKHQKVLSDYHEMKLKQALAYFNINPSVSNAEEINRRCHLYESQFGGQLLIDGVIRLSWNYKIEEPNFIDGVASTKASMNYKFHFKK